MEEAKAAAYYDELTRKGGAAARFKRGLGFSSSSAATASNDPPARGSALVSSSSSFLGGFVRASSPSKASELEKQSRLESVQNKLRKKSNERKPRAEERREVRVSSRRSRSRSREREEERERERLSRRRSRSRERDRDRHRRRRRSRSRSDSDGDRRRRERKRDRRAEKRNRSPSPPRDRKPKLSEKRNGGADYSTLIEGYDKMSQAERVKAKMKLQLAETVRKDETKGSSGWERFEFNKDAPLDEEEVQAAEDDTLLVKQIGQSFRSSAVQEKREQKIRDAHDEAMFGTPVFPPPVTTVNKEAEFETVAESKSEDETHKESNGIDVVANLLSEKVLAKQQSSWRDRARKQGN